MLLSGSLFKTLILLSSISVQAGKPNHLAGNNVSSVTDASKAFTQCLSFLLSHIAGIKTMCLLRTSVSRHVSICQLQSIRYHHLSRPSWVQQLASCAIQETMALLGQSSRHITYMKKVLSPLTSLWLQSYFQSQAATFTVTVVVMFISRASDSALIYQSA